MSFTNNFFVDNAGGLHDFYVDQIKVALYAGLVPESTAVYTPIGEVVSSGYTPGGVVCVQTVTELSTRQIKVQLAPVSLTNVTMLVGSILVYNASKSNKTIVALPVQSVLVTAQNLTIYLPDPLLLISGN